jgi:hypothetical protein
MPLVMHFASKSEPHGLALKLHRISEFGEVSNVGIQVQGPEKWASPETGTTVAINYLSQGVRAEFIRNASTRGGARNSATRESYGLSRAQVANLILAAHHASAIGLPFTRMITVHWEAAGIPLVGMAKATGRFIDMFSKALTRRDSQTTWLWVHESGDRKGGHCHLLAHVPAKFVREVTQLQMRWLKAITGRSYRARVIKSKPIGGRLGLELSNPDLHGLNLEAALLYCLKGANDDAAMAFLLDRLEAGGRIIGKRCGTSQNIGAKARSTLRIIP